MSVLFVVEIPILKKVVQKYRKSREKYRKSNNVITFWLLFLYFCTTFLSIGVSTKKKYRHLYWKKYRCHYFLSTSSIKVEVLYWAYYLKVQVHMYGWKPISKKKLLHRSDYLLIYRTIDKSTGAALMTSQVFFYHLFRHSLSKSQCCMSSFWKIPCHPALSSNKGDAPPLVH